MIGTPASCTVWVVDYVFTKPPRAAKVPGAAKKEDDKVANRIIVTTANPSGEDVFLVTRRLVLGENPYEGADFMVVHYQKMVDAMGVVALSSWEKLDGKAPEKLGVEVESEEEQDPEDGGSVPPAANLN